MSALSQKYSLRMCNNAVPCDFILNVGKKAELEKVRLFIIFLFNLIRLDLHDRVLKRDHAGKHWD